MSAGCSWAARCELGARQTFGRYVAIGVLAWVCLVQHDKLVTRRLKDKDQQAVQYNLRCDIGERDRAIIGRSQTEAADRGEADQICTADISSSFQKGVAVGRRSLRPNPSLTRRRPPCARP